MTFRAIVRDGLIVVNTHGEVPDGTPVEILLPHGSPTKGNRKRPLTKKARKKGPGRPTDPLFGFGMWKHRTDIKDSAAFARELRRRTSRRPLNG